MDREIGTDLALIGMGLTQPIILRFAKVFKGPFENLSNKIPKPIRKSRNLVRYDILWYVF
jgi:hypothetical protein